MKILSYEVHAAAELFPLLDEVGIQRLAEDIKAHGQKVPVVLLNGKVLDGRNRLLACAKAGVTPRTVQHNGEDPWRAVWSLNAERRQIEDKVRLTLICKCMVEGSDAWAAKQASAREATARARSEAAEKHRGPGGKLTSRPSREGPQVTPPASRDRSEPARAREATTRLALEAGVSRSTVERALELERKRPEAAKAVVRGEIEGHKALAEVKREVRVERLVAIAKGDAPLPVGQTADHYPVIYADPPWCYEHVKTDSRAIENQYPTMSLEGICALKVQALATPDATLFLWATSPKLAEAMQVITSWGFVYRSSMVWVKDRLGMGYYARQCHEMLLIATKGSPPTPKEGNRPRSVVEAPIGKHSSKPAVFAELIEKMYPELPKVELFCRSPREGWSAWGNQSAKGAA